MLVSRLLDKAFIDNKRSLLIREDSISLTYEDCENLSNFFSQSILALNPKGKLIGILMEKGWEQVVAVFSVIKSGKAFLPLNINESKERINQLLELGYATEA